MSANNTTNKNPKRRNALGRGLSALLDDSGPDTPTRERDQDRTTPAASTINEVALDAIEVNPFQPRTHFDQEVAGRAGRLYPGAGHHSAHHGAHLGGDRYQIISGERRVQASKRAGLTHIPAYVRQANDQQMLEMALIENIQRENLNAMEVALSYQRLISECDLRQEQLGERVGKNRSTVNNYLRLLRLPPDIQAALRDKRLSMGHARALINVDNVEQQLHIFSRIVQEDLSVRKVEALVRELAAPRPAKPPVAASSEPSYHIQQLQSKLSSHFGTRVQIKNQGNEKGEIKIPFVSSDDLSRILELLEVSS